MLAMISWDTLTSIVYGVVEGLTEWLPVSSTGHLLLLERWLPLHQRPAVLTLFLVIIQLGAILAVVVTFFSTLWPFATARTRRRHEVMTLGPLALNRPVVALWGKIIVACLPAVVVGLALDRVIEKHLYNALTVAIMLIVVGLAFLWVERVNKTRLATVDALSAITYKQALWIGCFQVVAAVLPGTSRSGATIIGAMLLGVSRRVAAQFTFVLAVPVMLGATCLKLLRVGLSFDAQEWAVLILGTVTAFAVSMVAIRLLLSFVRRHTFNPFAYYRIALGLVVLVLLGLH